jgi:hypothetical protein
MDKIMFFDQLDVLLDGIGTRETKIETKPLRGGGAGDGSHARAGANDVLTDDDRKVLRAGGKIQFEKIGRGEYRKTIHKGATRPSSRSEGRSTTTNARDAMATAARTLAKIDALQAQSIADQADQQREIAKRMQELECRQSMRQQMRSREQSAARVNLK